MTTMTESQLAATCPVEYAKAQNAEINARAKAEGWQCWSTLPEDPEYFASMGYTTALDYERDNLIGDISDTFKELNGFRPRWNYSEMSFSELEQAYAQICEDARAEREDRPARDLDDPTEYLEEAKSTFADVIGTDTVAKIKSHF